MIIVLKMPNLVSSLKLAEQSGSNSDQNNSICRLFQNVHPILKFNFD